MWNTRCSERIKEMKRRLRGRWVRDILAFRSRRNGDQGGTVFRDTSMAVERSANGQNETHENWKLPGQIPFSILEGETPGEAHLFRLDKHGRYTPSSGENETSQPGCRDECFIRRECVWYPRQLSW